MLKILQFFHNVLNLPECVKQNGTALASYVYLADGTKAEVYTGSSPGTGTGYTYLGSLRYTKTGNNYRLESTPFAAGRFMNNSGGMQPYYHITDHLGSIRVITDKNGSVQEQNDYYPYGGRHTSGNTYAALPGNNFKFNGKEEQTTGNLGYLDYGARMYDNVTGRWGTPDPLAEKYKSLSPYRYSFNNPINYIDPDGREEWPVKKTYKGYYRIHENNFGAPRPKGRIHKGVDINYEGAGNSDIGAPIIATHDGIITRLAIIKNGDKNAGGNRIQITSSDGNISTYYMHLDAISSELKEGMSVSEGQQIGTMGGSGNGKSDEYASHLHYQVEVEGVIINPAITPTNLIDPQKLITPINGGILPTVIVEGQKPFWKVPTTDIKMLPINEIKKIKFY